MGKWFANVLTTLVLLALTSIVAAFLKGPIDDWSAANRIQAQVQFSPWIPKVNISDLDEIEEGDTQQYREALEELEEKFRDIEIRYASFSNYGMLRINLENDSPEEITDVNFRLDSELGEQEVVFIDAEGAARPLGEVDRVRLPDMKPGDRIAVYMWGSFSPILVPNGFRSYSSEGSFRVSYDWPQTQDYEYQSEIAKFIDDWAETVGIVTVFLSVLGLWIAYSVYSDYTKNLLKNPEAYEAEHGRFEADPKGFEPDWTGVQKAATYLDAVKKDLLRRTAEAADHHQTKDEE